MRMMGIGLGFFVMSAVEANDVLRSVGRPNKEGKCQLPSGMLVASY